MGNPVLSIPETEEAANLTPADRAAWRIQALVTAWDAVKLCDARRLVECTGHLRATLDQARDLGDVSGLPCPLSVWTAAQGLAASWLQADPAVREGRLRTAVDAAMGALWSFHVGTQDQPVFRRGRPLAALERAAGAD